MRIAVDAAVQDAVEDIVVSWTAARKRAAATVLQHALYADDTVSKHSAIITKAREELPIDDDRSYDTFWRRTIHRPP